MPKPDAVTFNRYVSIASRVLRQALKEDKRVAAQKLDETEVRFAEWKSGKQGESKPLDLNVAKN